MRKKIRGKKRNRQEIEILVAELESSDLTVAQLAKREDVTVGAVYHWKNKVENQPTEPIEVVGPASIWPTQSHTSGVSLEINSIKCQVDPDFDQQTLIRVIDAIGRTFA